MEYEEPFRTPDAPHAAGPARRDWVVPLINGLTLVSVAGMALGAMTLAFQFVLRLIDRGVRVDLAIGMTALGLLTFLVALFMFSRKLPAMLGASPPLEGGRAASDGLPEHAQPQLSAPREPAHSVSDYTTRSLEHSRARRETVR